MNKESTNNDNSSLRSQQQQQQRITDLPAAAQIPPLLPSDIGGLGQDPHLDFLSRRDRLVSIIDYAIALVDDEEHGLVSVSDQGFHCVQREGQGSAQ